MGKSKRAIRNVLVTVISMAMLLTSSIVMVMAVDSTAFDTFEDSPGGYLSIIPPASSGDPAGYLFGTTNYYPSAAMSSDNYGIAMKEDPQTSKYVIDGYRSVFVDNTEVGDFVNLFGSNDSKVPLKDNTSYVASMLVKVPQAENGSGIYIQQVSWWGGSDNNRFYELIYDSAAGEFNTVMENNTVNDAMAVAKITGSENVYKVAIRFTTPVTSDAENLNRWFLRFQFAGKIACSFDNINIIESAADPATMYPADPAVSSEVLWSDDLESATGGAADAGYAGSKFYQSAQGYPSGVAVKGGDTPFNAGYVIDGDKSVFANSVGTTGFSWFTATNDSAAPIPGDGSYVVSFLLKLASPLESALYLQIRTWADEAADREKYPEYMISQAGDGTVSGSVAKASSVGGGYEKIVINKVSDDLYSVSISFKTSADITAAALSDKWWIRMAFVDGSDAVAIDNVTVFSTTEDPMYFPVAKPAAYMPPEASEVYSEDFEAAAGGPGDDGTSNGYIGSIFYGASNSTLPGGVAVINEPVVTSDFVIDGNKSAYFNGASLTPSDGYFKWFVMTNDSAAPIAGDKTYLIRFLLKTVKPMPANGALILHLRTWDDTEIARAKYPEFTIRQDASGKLSATQANTSPSDKIEIIRLDYDLYSIVMRVSTTTTDIAPVVANKWFVNFGVSKECTFAFDNFSVLQTSNTTEAAAYALSRPAGYEATNLSNWSTEGTTPDNAELLQKIDFENAVGGGLGTEFVDSKCYYGRSGNSALYTTIADKSDPENLIRGDMVVNGNKSASFVNRFDMDFSYWLQTVDNEAVGGFKMPGSSCYVATFLLKISRDLKYDEVNGSGSIFMDARTWADDQSAVFYLKPDQSNDLVPSVENASDANAPVPDNNEIALQKLDSDLYAVSVKFTTAYTTSSFFDNWFFEFGTYKTGSYSVDDISFYRVNGEADPVDFLLAKPEGYLGQTPEENVDEIPEETTTWVPLEDFDTGTIVEFIQEKLPEGVTDVMLGVNQIESGDTFNKFTAKAASDNSTIQGKILILELLDQDESLIETLEGGYKVKLLLDEGADPAKIKVYYLDPGTGNVIEITDVVVEEGYASFSVDTLGYFAYASYTEESEDDNPQTGDNNAIAFVMIVSLALLAVMTIFRKKVLHN